MLTHGKAKDRRRSAGMRLLRVEIPGSLCFHELTAISMRNVLGVDVDCSTLSLQVRLALPRHRAKLGVEAEQGSQ